MTKNKQFKTILCGAAISFLLFLCVLLSVKLVDIQAIGPNDSEIGLASLNSAVRDFFGVHMIWHDITDILGLFAIATAGAFGMLGLYQLIRRKSLKKVDADILLLGVFYVVVVGFYLFFELCIINYRPILMEGELEAAFPSSHTMITLCIMGSAMYQFGKRLKHAVLRCTTISASAILALMTALGRLFAGVHWLTDILGGFFLSAALVLLYIAICEKIRT